MGITSVVDYLGGEIELFRFMCVLIFAGFFLVCVYDPTKRVQITGGFVYIVALFVSRFQCFKQLGNLESRFFKQRVGFEGFKQLLKIIERKKSSITN